MIEESQIKQILGEIELAENILRKRETYKSFQICEGNLRYFVKERLKEMFPKTYDMFQVSDYSIIKKIVNKKAKAYKETPKRTLESDEETALYQDLVSKFNLNEAMKEIDKIYNQYKYCLLAVFFERSLNDFGVMEENFKFIPLAPYEFDVVFNEMGELQCVVLSYPDQEVVTGPPTDQLNTLIAGDVQDVGADRKVYAVWTKTNHWLYQGNKNKNGILKFGLYSNVRNLVSKVIYDEIKQTILPSYNQISIFQTKINNKFGFIQADGKTIVMPKYDELKELNSTKYNYEKMIQTKVENQYGLLFSNNNSIIFIEAFSPYQIQDVIKSYPEQSSQILPEQKVMAKRITLLKLKDNAGKFVGYAATNGQLFFKN